MTCTLGYINIIYIFKLSMYNRIFNVSLIQYVRRLNENFFILCIILNKISKMKSKDLFS